MMMRLGDILGRIFFMLSQKSIIGILSTEHTEDTDHRIVFVKP